MKISKKLKKKILGEIQEFFFKEIKHLFNTETSCPDNWSEEDKDIINFYESASLKLQEKISKIIDND